MFTDAFSRTRRPIGGRLASASPASCRAGQMCLSDVREAVKRSAWSITPAATSS
jgi:hypothetical protein